MTTIIAEIGSSPAPAWDFETWCAAAASTGADAVKVQLFRASHFPEAEQASKRPLEFPRDRLGEFVACAHAHGLTAGASVFDPDAVILANLYCDFIKLAAREQHNRTLYLLAFGTYKPLYRSVDEFYEISSLYTTLYAIQQYPAPMLLALGLVFRAAAAWKGKRWGWSSHTRTGAECRLAVHLGASVIERHLCLSHADLEGPHSSTPDEFRNLVQSIRSKEINHAT